MSVGIFSVQFLIVCVSRAEADFDKLVSFALVAIPSLIQPISQIPDEVMEMLLAHVLKANEVL